MENQVHKHVESIARILTGKATKAMGLVHLSFKQLPSKDTIHYDGHIKQEIPNKNHVPDLNDAGSMDDFCNLLLIRLMTDYNLLNDKGLNAIYFTVKHVSTPTLTPTNKISIVVDYTLYKTTKEIVYKEWKRPELEPVHHNQVDADYLNNLRIDTYLSMAADELLKEHGNRSISFTMRPVDEDILPHLKERWESKKFECIVARDTPKPGYFLITLKWSMASVIIKEEPKVSTVLTTSTNTIENKDEQL